MDSIWSPPLLVPSPPKIFGLCQSGLNMAIQVPPWTTTMVHPKSFGLCHFWLGFWNLGILVTPPQTTTSWDLGPWTTTPKILTLLFWVGLPEWSYLTFPWTTTIQKCLDFVILGWASRIGVDKCIYGGELWLRLKRLMIFLKVWFVENTAQSFCRINHIGWYNQETK